MGDDDPVLQGRRLANCHAAILRDMHQKMFPGNDPETRESEFQEVLELVLVHVRVWIFFGGFAVSVRLSPHVYLVLPYPNLPILSIHGLAIKIELNRFRRPDFDVARLALNDAVFHAVNAALQ